MISSALLAASLFATAPGMAGGISGINVTDDQVVLRFDDSVGQASAFLLDSPQRIALDIRGAQAGPVRYSDARGTVASVRNGQFNADTARVVLDLSRPAVVSRASFAADGKSLTLSLKDVDAGSFKEALMRGRRDFESPVASAAQRPKKRHSITVPIPEPAKGLSLPPVEGPRDRNKPLIVIDAGHGGHDPGAINKETGTREKDLTLAIAKAIRSELLKSGRVRVALTRDDDAYLILHERYGVARRLGADLFISIHADAAENTEASGATIYTLSEVASDREAARLAARENKADIINGINLGEQTSDVSSILIDLTQRETMNVSANFARLLQREAAPYVPFRQSFHRFASLMVLKAPDTPSILFETGYISNASDVRMLGSRDGQERIAKGVAKAVEVHFARKIAAK